MKIINKLILTLLLTGMVSIQSQAMQSNLVKPVVSFLADLEPGEAINLGLFLAAFPASYGAGKAMQQIPEADVRHLVGFTIVGMIFYGIPASLLMYGLSQGAKRLNA